MSDERLLALKERAAEHLMRIPGVTGVGLGGRERARRPTGEIVLKVFVRRKRPLAELTPGETLPPQFEGVGVDVSELSVVAPDAAPTPPDPAPVPPEDPPPGAPDTTNIDWDETDYRPLTGGGRIKADVIGVSRGTMGCLLVHADDPNKVYALTNYHVLASFAAKQFPVVNVTRVGQSDLAPSPVKIRRAGFGAFAGGDLDTVRDAALIQLDVGTKWLAEIIEIGPVTGPYTVTVNDVTGLTYRVRKRGARTRLTGGIVESVNTEITSKTDGIETTRKNVLVVRPNPNPKIPAGGTVRFADGGDSGSAVVNDKAEVVALHYASDPRPQDPKDPVRKGCALPIEEILKRFLDVEKLPVRLATASKNGQVNVVRKTNPKAAPWELGMQALGVVPPSRELMAREGTERDRSPAGRQLLAVWLDHQAELLSLLNAYRRSPAGRHRGGGPTSLYPPVRALGDPGFPVPRTVHGEPPAPRIVRMRAALRAAASPGLRRALDQALAES